MKFVKSKNILIASILSMFLVQIINSVYIPIAKPIEKPEAKPVAKPKLRTAPPVEITIQIPAGTTGIGTVALGGDKGILV